MIEPEAVAPECKLAVVILTYNRRREILRTLERTVAEHPDLPVCVVDNGSSDGSREAIARRFPRVLLVALPANQGAAGRNQGVRRVPATYVAFCDDDAWWAPGSLARAVALLDAFPDVAVVTARVLVGPEARVDPASACMAASPLPNVLGFPGAAVAGFLAGACVVRRRAFLDLGGYEPRLFIGGEERLLALDLMAAGWHMAYAPQLVVHHHPSGRRDHAGRRRLLLRNALWCAWLRRPLPGACRESLARLAEIVREPRLAAGLLAAARGIPWVLRNRRVIPGQVEALLRLLDGVPR